MLCSWNKCSKLRPFKFNLDVTRVLPVQPEAWVELRKMTAVNPYLTFTVTVLFQTPSTVTAKFLWSKYLCKGATFYINSWFVAILFYLYTQKKWGLFHMNWPVFSGKLAHVQMGLIIAQTLLSQMCVFSSSLFTGTLCNQRCVVKFWLISRSINLYWVYVSNKIQCPFFSDIYLKVLLELLPLRCEELVILGTDDSLRRQLRIWKWAYKNIKWIKNYKNTFWRENNSCTVSKTTR